MKLNLRQFATAGVLLASSATAFADLTQNDVTTAQSAATLNGAAQGATGFSSLVFAAYNVDGTFSLVQSLGTKGNSPTAATGFGINNTDQSGLSLTYQLDSSGSLLANNASSLVWGVYGYDTSGDPTAAAGQWRLISTVANGSDVNAVIPSTATISSNGGVVNSFLTSNPSAAASVISTTAGAVENWATGTDISTLTSSINTVTSATGSLAMYLFSNALGDSTGTPGTSAAYAGTWSLNAAAGTLTYQVAPVPLPAAAWLLLSGLGGLGVIGRRRAAAKLAA